MPKKRKNNNDNQEALVPVLEKINKSMEKSNYSSFIVATASLILSLCLVALTYAQIAPNVVSSQLSCDTESSFNGVILKPIEFSNFGLLTTFGYTIKTDGFKCTTDFGDYYSDSDYDKYNSTECSGGQALAEGHPAYYRILLIPIKNHTGNYKFSVDYVYNVFSIPRFQRIAECEYEKREFTPGGYVFTQAKNKPLPFDYTFWLLFAFAVSEAVVFFYWIGRKGKNRESCDDKS